MAIGVLKPPAFGYDTRTAEHRRLIVDYLVSLGVAFEDALSFYSNGDGTYRSVEASVMASATVRLDTTFAITAASTWQRIATGWTVIFDDDGLWDAGNQEWTLTADALPLVVRLTFQGSMENTATGARGAAIGMGEGAAHPEGGGSGTQDLSGLRMVAGQEIPRRQDFPQTIYPAVSPLFAVPANTTQTFAPWAIATAANDVNVLNDRATWLSMEVVGFGR